MIMISRGLVVLVLGAGSACLGAPTVIRVILPTNDTVYDPSSDRIFASVPGRAGVQRGSTITPIDPYTGEFGTSVFVTSEPNKLALTDDGARIYVASDSTNTVTPFSLETMSPGLPFPIGEENKRVEDMESVPGNPNALVVSRQRDSVNNEGLAVFVDGEMLPRTTTNYANEIEFGAAPGILYGLNNQTSSFDFITYSVDVSPGGGVVAGFNETELVEEYDLGMEFDNGRMYFTNGQVADVIVPAPVGSFTASGPVEPVSSSGRTYFVVGNKLKSFSQSRFVPLGEMTIPEFTGAAKNLISLGGSALALTTTTDQVFIIRLPGDYDANGVVSAADYDIWKANYGSTTNLVADANQDNIVDAADYVVWRKNLGQTLVGTEGGVSSSNVAAPEPAPLLTLVLGAAASLRMRRRG
jgi:DNA-binding beta-propeller fold protein YncE